MVTLKEIIKSTTYSVRNATSDSQGQVTFDCIQQYIDEQTSANNDEHSTTIALLEPSQIDRLSQELVQLYETTVMTKQINNNTSTLTPTPATMIISCKPDIARIHAQHYILLRSLRALLPILRPKKIFQDWFGMFLKPILMTANYTNQIKKETRLIISDCLIMEQELVRENNNNQQDCVYFDMIVCEYLEWAESIFERQEKEDGKRDETSRQHQALLDLEEDEWSKNLTAILLSVGASETKEFFVQLNKYFLSSKHRLQIVYLLSEFMRRRRTHLHEILDTPLFDSMLKSLMYDNSTTLIAISVTNLIMLLPRMCTSLPQFLPQLFYIFARAICWDQLRDLRKKQSSLPSITLSDWDIVDYTFSKLSAPPSNPQTGAFFTSLYGLYPCNFLKFLYKPYGYFKESSFVPPEEFDEDTFKNRTIPQVTRHMLHPNLVVMDASTELTDKTRWMKMEPPDVIAQIMSLDLTNAASRVAFMFDEEKEEKEERKKNELLDEYLFDEENTPTLTGTSISNNDMTAEPLDNQALDNNTTNTITSKSLMINSIVTLHKALKSGAEVLVGEDVWDAEAELHNNAATTSSHLSPAPTRVNEISTKNKLLLAALKREVLLLRNELNFELFLKQQHLQHIGRLHREHVLDSSVEAERQQLYNTTRMLKTQLKQTTDAYEKLKSESALSKQRHVQWESEQSGKLQNYREARKEWQNQMARAEHQIGAYETQLDEQRVQLDQARQQVFELEMELKTLEPTVNKVTETEHRVKQLTQQMLLWEEDTSRMEEQKAYIKGLLSQWWSMEELVASLHAENRRFREKQIDNEESFEKLKIQSKEYKNKLMSLNRTFESKDKESCEVDRLKRTMQELKTRLEELEVEKLEWNAQVEASRASLQAQDSPTTINATKA